MGKPEANMVCGRLFLMKCIFASAVIASAVILDEQIVPEEEFTEIVAADPIRVRVMAHPTEYALPSSTVVAPVPEEEFPDTVPEPTATAANGQSWTDSQQVCTNQGKQLCTFDKICPNGEGSTPVDGGSSVGHDWSPMLRADGVTNDWVHISGSGHSNCKPHGKYHGLPGWGTQPSNTYNHRIYCCGQPSTGSAATFTIQQKVNMRYMDANESSNDHSAVTRTVQGNDSQKWIVTASDEGFTCPN